MANLKLFVAALAGCLLLVSGVVNADSRYGKQKVVYHINYDDPKKQAGALRNIQNHINAVGKENLDLRVVMHGNGLSLVLLPDSLDFLKKFKRANANDVMTAKLDNLKGQGVKFHVCGNTIRGRKVDLARDAHDIDKSDIVPSGVAELSHLQQQGFTYLRP